MRHDIADVMKERLEELIAKHGLKHWSFAARKDQEFMAWVEERIPVELRDAPFAQQVYSAVHGESITCHLGNRKGFDSIERGFRFCGRAGKCPCAAASVSEKCKTNIDHEARLKASRAGMLAKYGVENPGQTPKAKAAHAAFYSDPEKVAKAVAKGKVSLEKSGYRDEQRKRTVERQKQRRLENLDRWNTPFEGDIPEGAISCAICHRPCKMMTEAHCRLHGISLHDYTKRFPDAPVNSNSVILSRRSTMRSEANVKRIQEYAKASLPHEARDLLYDEARLLERLLKSSTITIAREIGVDPETVRRYAIGYGFVFSTTSSQQENEIKMFLTKKQIPFIERSRKLIPPKELDFFLPTHNIAIEYNGLYWHRDKGDNRLYHREKWEACQRAGIRLLMVNEDEWLKRPEVIKSKILNLCGLSTRGCGARKLRVKLINGNLAKKFIEQYHIQGAPNSPTHAYGAFDSNGSLVAVLTFSQQRGTKRVELSRFCSDGLVYPGCFTKMLKTARQTIVDEIITFADLRYSDGGLYLNNGFNLDGEIGPDYRYFKGLETFHKSLFTKARIEKKFGIDMSSKTESEAMRELGFHRIYDCGKLRFTL